MNVNLARLTSNVSFYKHFTVTDLAEDLPNITFSATVFNDVTGECMLRVEMSYTSHWLLS